MDTYPIVMDGKRVGTLELTRQGLMSVFRASMPDSGELVRLSVYGEGREGYLGLMTPDGKGGLYLERKLSRAALATYPWDIDHAGPAGELTEKPVPPPELKPDPEPEPEVMPEPIPEPEPELLWFSAPDGCLSAFDGRRLLIAMPAGEIRLPRGAEGILRRINGREYIVFPR